MQPRSTTDLALLLLGLFAWAVAGVLAVWSPTVEVDVVTQTGARITSRAQSLPAAGAAGGFALAGSVCFLGAAFAPRDFGRHPGPGGPPAAPGAAP
jgi:hypothetical protein